VQAFREAMLEVARANPEVMSSPPPEVYFVGFGDSSLDFEIAVWASDKAYRPLGFRSSLYYAIEARLREAGIEIPFPQRDLHVRSSSTTLPIRIDGATTRPEDSR
jgi:small-conductance mechanosensitive channel